MEQWLLLLGEHAGPTAILILATIAFIFYCGATFNRMGSMQRRMSNLITKEDLRLALSDFKDELKDVFVTVKECELLHRESHIPMQEHADLMARMNGAEKNIEKLQFQRGKS